MTPRFTHIKTAATGVLPIERASKTDMLSVLAMYQQLYSNTNHLLICVVYSTLQIFYWGVRFSGFSAHERAHSHNGSDRESTYLGQNLGILLGGFFCTNYAQPAQMVPKMRTNLLHYFIILYLTTSQW